MQKADVQFCTTSSKSRIKLAIKESNLNLCKILKISNSFLSIENRLNHSSKMHNVAISDKPKKIKANIIKILYLMSNSYLQQIKAHRKMLNFYSMGWVLKRYFQYQSDSKYTENL